MPQKINVNNANANIIPTKDNEPNIRHATRSLGHEAGI